MCLQNLYFTICQGGGLNGMGEDPDSPNSRQFRSCYCLLRCFGDFGSVSGERSCGLLSLRSLSLLRGQLDSSRASDNFLETEQMLLGALEYEHTVLFEHSMIQS